MATSKTPAPAYDVNIDSRRWFNTSIAQAWPPVPKVISGETNNKANYSLDVTLNGQQYTFIPDSVINKGVVVDYNNIDNRAGVKNFFLPWFLDKDNQKTLAEVGKKIDLSNSNISDYLKNEMGSSTSGILIPVNSLNFDSTIESINANGQIAATKPIVGMTTFKGENVYSQGKDHFVDATGQTKTIKYTSSGGGGGFLDDIGLGFVEDAAKGLVGGTSDFLKSAGDFIGDTYMDVRDPLQAAAVVAGNYYLPGSSLVTSKLVSDEAKDILATDEFRLANTAAGITGGVQGNMANYGKVGETLGMTSADPNAIGGVTGPDNIDVGGGWSPAAGATEAELEAARLALETPSAPEVTADQITNEISSNAANAPDNIDAGNGWSPATGATEAELAKARSLMAANGWTLKESLDAVRAGLLVNALTGDPLGLGGDKPSDQSGTGGTSGFSIVPVPAEWKSPTYAPIAAPIDLSTIFSNENMLGGTQWQNLPMQRNVTFNDIFAAGQQQTPMGSPVDINQIVSSILGQAATSQKPA